MWFAEDVGSASGKTRKLALPQPSAVSSTLQHRSRAASSLPLSAPVWRRRTEGCPRARSARTAHGCRLAARRRITRTHRRTRRLHVLVRCSGSGRRTTRSARSTTRPDRSGSRREPRVAKTSSAVGPFAEGWACSSAARPSASRTRIAASPAPAGARSRSPVGRPRSVEPVPRHQRAPRGGQPATSRHWPMGRTGSPCRAP